MVRKNGKEGYRSFTIVGASKTAAQCKTKGKGGRYINKSPSQAAKKAFTELCRTKNIRGVCTLFLTLRDTTSGGRNKGKMYTYKLQRLKLKKPMIMLEGTDREYVIEYKSKVLSVMKGDAIKCDVDKEDGPGQTRGRAKNRTAKKTRVTANNVRKMDARAAKQPTRRSRRLANKKGKQNNLFNKLKNAMVAPENTNVVNNKSKKSKKNNNSLKAVRRSKRLAAKKN